MYLNHEPPDRFEKKIRFQLEVMKENDFVKMYHSLYGIYLS